MRKITNKLHHLHQLAIYALCLACLACGSGDKDEEPRTNEHIMDEVSTVRAVGKVSPASEWTVLSSPLTAKIDRIEVSEGDTVAAGDLLFSLDARVPALSVDEARAQLAKASADRVAGLEELRKAQIRAEELRNIYETSLKLFEQGAETKEKVDSDRSNWEQQRQTTAALEQNLRAQQALQQEAAVRVQQAEAELADYYVTAPIAGVVAELTISPGQTVTPTETLGQLADLSEPIVEAEVDELFAHDVAVGQTVQLLALGRTDILASGTIFYASPILSNKSILYETANEGEDRRVRRIKIRLEGPHTLTINAKVDCAIKIK